MDLSPLQLGLAVAALAVGSLVQGSIGFGALVVAAPLLVLIDTGFVPGPALTAATVLVVLIAYRDRGSVEMRGVGWTLIGRLPGTVAGAYLVASLSQTGLELFFGSVLLVLVVMSVRTEPLERTTPVLLGAGALSGLTATATSVGGPPLALVYQAEQGPTIRGTLNTIFVVGGLISLGMLAAVGEYGREEFFSGLAISPGVVVGFVASNATRRILDRRTLRPWVLGVSAASALAVLISALT